MSNGYGFAGSVGFAKESSGNTPVTADNFIEALSESMRLEIDRYQTKSIINGYYEPDDSDGLKRVSGDVVTAVHPVDIGYFLMGAMGVQSATEVAVGELWTTEHTMRTSDWDAAYAQQPFTFEMFRDVTSAQRYSGVNFNSLNFAISPNQDLRVTAGLIGTDASNVDPAAVSYTNSPTFPYAFDTASIAIAGAANAKLESFNLSINNNLEGVPALNNSSIIRMIRRTGPQLIRLGGTIAFEDITEYLDFTNQTERTMTFNVTRANSFEMTFHVPRFVYSGFPLGNGGRERQVVQFEGIARYNAGSGHAIKIDLTTTQSYF